MSQPEFTRRGVMATSALVGGAALAGGGTTQLAAATPAQSAAGGGVAQIPNNKPGSAPGEAIGGAGEIHQVATGTAPVLTTNQGVPVGDDQNSLKIGSRGPVLLEDFLLIEKINHFDHERIPERVVHARGVGAHGFFEPTASLAEFSKADLFQRWVSASPCSRGSRRWRAARARSIWRATCADLQ